MIVERTFLGVATCFLVLMTGCSKGTVPTAHTSLVVDPGHNPGKPPRPLSMVWLHHSTGDSLLEGGLLAALKADGIDFHDINYKEAVVDGYVVGDHTDPEDFPKTFNTAKYFDVVKGWELEGAKKQHDIIMFKSCFPASDITDDEMLESYKKWYLSMIPTFKLHPGILFVAMSTPPLIKYETKPDRAKRARTWAKWVTTEYPKQADNVKVFDLFDSLAIAEGKPDENTLVPQFASGRRDSHPSKAGALAMTRQFIPWLNRTLPRTGGGEAK